MRLNILSHISRRTELLIVYLLRQWKLNKLTGVSNSHITKINNNISI